MVELMMLWLLMLVVSIHTRGNAMIVFVLGYLTALIWSACFFVNTYDFKLKSSFPNEKTELSNDARNGL